jgi:hypothetical protein
MTENLAQHFLDEALNSYRSIKAQGDKALAANSIGILIKHLSGNMLSRWTDFLTTDGEKPDRDRDMEFVLTPETSRDELLARWEEGWRCTFDALESLRAEDVERVVMIRNEPHTVLKAIIRQNSHYAQHVGQIVFLAKHFRSREWKTLSIPRNRSAEFNERMSEQSKQSK